MALFILNHCDLATDTTKEGKQAMNIKGGFVECKKNEVSLCVEV